MSSTDSDGYFQKQPQDVREGFDLKHPSSSNIADHLAREREAVGGANAGKSLIEKVQEHLDGLIQGANEHGCKLRGLEHRMKPCRECIAYELGMNEAAGCAAALGILRATSLDIEMDLARERLGVQ